MRPILLALVVMLAACQPSSTEVAPAAPSFAISFSAEASGASLDGRLILILSKDDEREPRSQGRPGSRAGVSRTSSTSTPVRTMPSP